MTHGVAAATVPRALASGAAVLSMVAWAFAPRRSRGRQRLTTVVVGSMAATTTLTTLGRWGRRAPAALGVIGAGSWAIEAIGVRTGRPFGHYRYNDVLRPQVGGVPLVVPAAWVAMALPAREAAHAALRTRSTRVTRIGVGAVALTAWDLFLDPQMTGESYWSWKSAGRYRGIPLSNFAGWLAFAAVLMAALETLAPVDDEPDAALVAEYAALAGMETFAFATFFRDPAVAAVGGLAMGGVAATAVTGLLGQRP